MADGDSILRLLAARAPHPVSIDEIAPFPPKSKERQLILQAVGNLMNRKLAARHPHIKLPVHYVATEKGVALIAAGGRVTSGPTAPHTGMRKPVAGTLRERLWAAIRIKGKFSIPDILEIALRSGEDSDKAAHNAQRYVKALVAVGMLIELPVKAAGYAAASRGFKRFALLRDPGPKAPQVSFTKGFVFETNKRERKFFNPEERAA